MRQVRAQDLRAGMVFHEGLYSRYGMKLLAGGIPLTAEMCGTLRRSKQGVFYLARTAAELATAGMLREVEPPSAGSVAAETLVTEGGVPALGAGQVAEQHHDDAFVMGSYAAAHDEDGGPEIAAEDRSARVRAHASLRKMADRIVERRSEVWARLARRVEAGPIPVLDEGLQCGGDGSESQFQFPTVADPVAYRASRVEAQRRILATLLAGLPLDARTPMALVDELIERALAEPARFAQVALQTPRVDESLPNHSLTVAALTVAIGVRLRWSRWDVRAAGLAGLLADVGMTILSSDVRHAERRLNEVEVNAVRRHPQYSVVMLEEIRDLPEVVRLAVYQHHERGDRTGYPTAARTEAIHDFAKAVAVADEYTAATAARSYRPGAVPFSAMEALIESAATGRIERRFVKALVEVCGLFPVGSFVRLSDETIAEIVGVSDPARPDRPMVRTYRAGVFGSPIDLASVGVEELQVVQAVEIPAGELVRIRRAA